MNSEIFVVIVPAAGDSKADSNELATLLEKCCFRDPVLQRSYIRHFEVSANAPLGLTWNGVLKFVIGSKELLTAFSKAILTALRETDVEVRVKCRDKEVVFRTPNANLIQVMTVVESILERLD